MRTYNYLSNELPRELIELYSEIEQDVLRVIVKNIRRLNFSFFLKNILKMLDILFYLCYTLVKQK